MKLGHVVRQSGSLEQDFNHYTLLPLSQEVNSDVIGYLSYADSSGEMLEIQG